MKKMWEIRDDRRILLTTHNQFMMDEGEEVRCSQTRLLQLTQRRITTLIMRTTTTTTLSRARLALRISIILLKVRISAPSGLSHLLQ